MAQSSAQTDPKRCQNVQSGPEAKICNFFASLMEFILAEFDRWLALDEFELERGQSLAKG